ncbi:hypothetical protein [Microbacterium sp. NPDC057944]|uniref:hypothetical protein n=1 Tax=Microbacterium sp. NPDC057944 TaxID=3346286 RepID=UPI0036DB109D
MKKSNLLIRAAVIASLVVGGLAFGAASPASAATIVGTPNLTAYCKVNVGAVWYAQTQSLVSPYYWRCTNSATHALIQIDVNKACRQQFGTTSYAIVVANNPNGWRCVR